MQADSKTVFLGQLNAIITQVRQVLRTSTSSNTVVGELKKSVEDILAAVELCRDEHSALRTPLVKGANGSFAVLNEGKSQEVESSSPSLSSTTPGPLSSSTSSGVIAVVPTEEERGVSSSSFPLLSNAKGSRSEGGDSPLCLPPDQGIGDLSLVDLIQWIAKLFMVEPHDVSVAMPASSSSSGGGGGSSANTPGLRLRMLGKNLLQIVQVRCISALRECLHLVTRLTYPPQRISPLSPPQRSSSAAAVADVPSGTAASPFLLSAVQLARAISTTAAALKECIILATSLYQPEVVASAEQVISAGIANKAITLGAQAALSAGRIPSSSSRDEGGKGSKGENAMTTFTTPSAEASAVNAAMAVWKQARFPLQMASEVVKEVHKMLRIFSSIVEKAEHALWSSPTSTLHEDNRIHRSYPSNKECETEQEDPVKGSSLPNPAAASSFTSHLLDSQGRTLLEHRVHQRAEELTCQWGCALAQALKEIAPSITPAVEFLASIAVPLSASQNLQRMPPPLSSWYASCIPETPRARAEKEREGAADVSPGRSSQHSNVSAAMMDTSRRRSTLTGGMLSSSSGGGTSFTTVGAEATVTLLGLSLLPPLVVLSSYSLASVGTLETVGEKEECLVTTPTNYNRSQSEESIPSSTQGKGEEGVKEKTSSSPSTSMRPPSFIFFTQLLLTQVGISFTMEFLVILANHAVHTMEDGPTTSGSSTSTASGTANNASRYRPKKDVGVVSHRIVSETVREAGRSFPLLLSYMLAAQKRWRNSILNYILVKFVSLSVKGGGWPAALVDLRFLTTAVMASTTGSTTTSNGKVRTIMCSEIGLLYTRCIFRFLESPNTSLYVKRELVVHLIQTFLESPSFTSTSPILDRAPHEPSSTVVSPSPSPAGDALPRVPLLLRLYYSFDLDVHAHSMNVVQQFIAVLCRVVRLSSPAELWKEVEQQAQLPRARKAQRQGEQRSSGTTTGDGEGSGEPPQESPQTGNSGAAQGPLSESRTSHPSGNEVHHASAKKELEQAPTPSTPSAATPCSPSFLALQGLLMIIELWHGLQPPERAMEPGMTLLSPSTTEDSITGMEECDTSMDALCIPSEAHLCRIFSFTAMQEMRERKQKEQYLADVFNRSSAKALQKIVHLTPEEVHPPGTEDFCKSWEAIKLPRPASSETQAKIEAVAHFIWSSPPSSLQPQAVADYITSPDVFALQVCHYLMRRLRLRGLPLIAALEELLLSFALPKEGQRIERLLEYFCDAYFDLNQGPDVDTANAFPFVDKDACFLVTVATVMLNTSLHNRRAASPMTSKVFCEQLQGCNGEKEFPKHYLEEIYQGIAQHPLRSAFSSPGIAGAAASASLGSSSSLSYSAADIEEVSSSVLESLFITAEERKNVSFGLERQRVMSDVHQSLYARATPSPALPLPSFASLPSGAILPFTATAKVATTPVTSSFPCTTFPSSSFFSSVPACAKWWCPLQVARDLFLHSWSSVSSVFSPSFYGKTDDPIGLLLMLPTCLRGLQGLLEVATAFALPHPVEHLLHAILRVEKLSSSMPLLSPIKEASRWAILNIASSPYGILLSSSCWKIVFRVMWRARVERYRLNNRRPSAVPTNSSNPSRTSSKGVGGTGKADVHSDEGVSTSSEPGGGGAGGATATVKSALATTTAPIEEEVFSRIEGWTAVVDEGRENENTQEENLDVNEKRSTQLHPSEDEKDSLKLNDRKGSIVDHSITSFSNFGCKEEVGMENSTDNFLFFRIPSPQDGVDHVLQALMALLTQEVTSALGADSTSGGIGNSAVGSGQAAASGEGESEESFRTIQHLFDIIERCLCCTQIIRETAWYSNGKMERRGKGATRLLQRINVYDFHRVVIPSLITSLEMMMMAPTSLSNPSTSSAIPTAGTEAAALNAIKDFILPSMGSFITKTFQLLWVCATRGTLSSRKEWYFSSPSAADLPEVEHRTRPVSSPESPPPSMAALTEEIFPLLPTCLECFDLFRIILHDTRQATKPEENDPTMEVGDELVVEGSEGGGGVEEKKKKRFSYTMYYTVRGYVLQWIVALASEAMPSHASSSSPLLSVAALLPFPPTLWWLPTTEITYTSPRTPLYPMLGLWHRLLSPLIWIFSSPQHTQSSALSASFAFSTTSATHWRTSSSVSLSDGMGSGKNNSARGRERRRPPSEEDKQHRYWIKLEKKSALKAFIQCVESCSASVQRLTKAAEAERQKKMTESPAHSTTPEKEMEIPPSPSTRMSPAEKKGTGEGEEEEVYALRVRAQWLHRLAFLLHSPLILLSHMCYIIVISHCRSDAHIQAPEDPLPSRTAILLLYTLCVAGLTLFTATHHPSCPWPVHRLLFSPSPLPQPHISPTPTPPSSSSSSQAPRFLSGSSSGLTYHQLWTAFVHQLEMGIVGGEVEADCPSPFASASSATPCAAPPPEPLFTPCASTVTASGHPKEEEHTGEANELSFPTEEAGDSTAPPASHSTKETLFPRTAFAAYPIHLLERFCLLLRCEQEDIRTEVVNCLRQLLLLLPSFESFTVTRLPPPSPCSPCHASPDRAEETMERRMTCTVHNAIHYHLAVVLIRVIQSSTAVLRTGPLSLLHPELLSFWLFLIRDVPPSMRFCSRNSFRTTTLEPVLQLLALDLIKVCPPATRLQVGTLVLEHCLTVLVASPSSSFPTKNMSALFFHKCLKGLLLLGVSQPKVVQEVVQRCVGLMLLSVRPITISYYDGLEQKSSPTSSTAPWSVTQKPMTSAMEEEEDGHGNFSTRPTRPKGPHLQMATGATKGTRLEGSGDAREERSSSVVEKGSQGEEEVLAEPSLEGGYYYTGSTVPAALHVFQRDFIQYVYRGEDVLEVLPLVNWRLVGKTVVKPRTVSRGLSFLLSGEEKSHLTLATSFRTTLPCSASTAPLRTEWKEEGEAETALPSLLQTAILTPAPRTAALPTPQEDGHRSPLLPLLLMNSLLPSEDEGPFDVLCRASLGNAAWREQRQRPTTTSSSALPPLSSLAPPPRRRCQRVSIDVRGNAAAAHLHTRGEYTPLRDSSSRRHLSTEDHSHATGGRRSGRERRRKAPSTSVSPVNATPRNTSAEKELGADSLPSTPHDRRTSPPLSPLHQPAYYTLLHNIFLGIPTCLFQLDQACRSGTSRKRGTTTSPPPAKDIPSTTVSYPASTPTTAVTCVTSPKRYPILHPPTSVAPTVSLSVLLLLVGEVIYAMQLVFQHVMQWSPPLVPSPLEGVPLPLSSLPYPSSPSLVLPHLAIRGALSSYLEVAMIGLFSGEEEEERKVLETGTMKETETPKAKKEGDDPSFHSDDDDTSAMESPARYPFSLLREVFCSSAVLLRRITHEIKDLPSSCSTSDPASRDDRLGSEEPSHTEPVSAGAPMSSPETSSIALPPSIALVPHLQEMQTELKTALGSWIRRLLVVKSWYTEQKENKTGISSAAHTRIEIFLQECLQGDVCEAVVELLPSDAQHPLERDVKHYLQWFLVQRKEDTAADGE